MGLSMFIGFLLVANFFISLYMYLNQEFLIPKRNLFGLKAGEYDLTRDETKSFAKKQMFGCALMITALAMNNILSQYHINVCLLASLLFLIGLYYVIIGHRQVYKLDKMRSE